MKSQSDTTGFEERPYFLLIEQSEKALEDNDYESAALRLVEAMGMEPDNPLNVALLSNLGMIYFYDEKDSLALDVLDEVIKRSPRLIAGHENKARILMSMGRDNEAYHEYAKIIEIDSINTNARYYHGMMALYSGNLKCAEADFDVLKRVVPLARTTYLALGTLYSMTGREAQAVHYFRKLIDVEPAAEYYASLAGCYLVTGDLAAASDLIEKGLEKYPNDGELYYYRGWLKRDRYEYEGSAADCKKALELGVNPQKVDELLKR